MFVLVFNGSEFRADEQQKGILKIFTMMFGLQCLDNAVMVFTNWDLSKKAQKKRKQSGQSEDKVEEQFNDEVIKKHLKFPNHVRTFFIDNIPDEEDKAEVAAVETTRRKIIEFATKLAPFECTDIEKGQEQREEKERMEATKQKELAALQLEIKHAHDIQAEAKLLKELQAKLQEVKQLEAKLQRKSNKMQQNQETQLANIENIARAVANENNVKRRSEVDEANRRFKQHEKLQNMAQHTARAVANATYVKRQSEIDEILITRLYDQRTRGDGRRSGGRRCGKTTTRGEPCKKFAATCPYH